MQTLNEVLDYLTAEGLTQDDAIRDYKNMEDIVKDLRSNEKFLKQVVEIAIEAYPKILLKRLMGGNNDAVSVSELASHLLAGVKLGILIGQKMYSPPPEEMPR